LDKTCNTTKAFFYFIYLFNYNLATGGSLTGAILLCHVKPFNHAITLTYAFVSWLFVPTHVSKFYVETYRISEKQRLRI